MNGLFVGKICVIRANGAGVFLAEVVEQAGTNVLIKNARRLWQWQGASSIDEIAMKGVARPADCKFPCVVSEKYVTNVLEIIPATQEAINCINNVPTWGYSR